ncbi:hypothetical protein STANM309S_02751 [Streptomyces tanashiensis]
MYGGRIEGGTGSQIPSRGAWGPRHSGELGPQVVDERRRLRSPLRRAEDVVVGPDQQGRTVAAPQIREVDAVQIGRGGAVVTAATAFTGVTAVTDGGRIETDHVGAQAREESEAAPRRGRRAGG